MSDTRRKALAYLREKGFKDVSEELLSASKLYKPEESWTGKETWWFDLHISKIESNADKDYCLVCESKTDKFVVLKVPNRFLLDNLDRFDTKSGDMIRLHLAAYPENWLVDERVENGVDFSKFEIK
jgi:hypothetical protein